MDLKSTYLRSFPIFLFFVNKYRRKIADTPHPGYPCTRAEEIDPVPANKMTKEVFPDIWESFSPLMIKKKTRNPSSFLLLNSLVRTRCLGLLHPYRDHRGRQASHRMPTQNPNIAEALNLLWSLILRILKWRKIKCLPFKLCLGGGLGEFCWGFLLFAEFCEIYSSRKCWKMKLSTLKLLITTLEIFHTKCGSPPLQPKKNSF